MLRKLVLKVYTSLCVAGDTQLEQTYQAVQLGYWTLAARLADVPDLDATLAASVDMTGGVADGDGADHFPVAQRVDLASVARDARAYQCIRREGHWLHLSVCTHVKRISSAEDTDTISPSLLGSGKMWIRPKLTVFLRGWM